MKLTTAVGPSRWAIEKFGEHAEALREVVPAAIGAAVERQMEAHAASRLSTLQAFGGAWPARYEEFVERLKGFAGVEVVRPAGAAFQLAVVNGQVLVPFRYADDLGTSHREPRVTKRLNKGVRELLSEYGATPEWVTEELFTISGAVTPGARLLGDVRPEGMVLVFFAANAKAGLLSLGWGEAAAVAGGELVWGFTEILPLPKPLSSVGGPPAPVDGPRIVAGGGSPLPRFDDAPMVAPEITARNAPVEAGGPLGGKAAEE